MIGETRYCRACQRDHDVESFVRFIDGKRHEMAQCLMSISAEARADRARIKVQKSVKFMSKKPRFEDYCKSCGDPKRNHTPACSVTRCECQVFRASDVRPWA